MRKEGVKTWMRRQSIEPICIAIDYHSSSSPETRWEYVFRNSDYVMKQYCWINQHVSIEDHWSGEVLASTTSMHGGDAVACAEEMLQNARGNSIIGKDIVEKIIYKLMVGDIRLMRDDFLM